MNRRRFLKTCFHSLLAAGCVQTWNILETSAAFRKIPVLLYHRIGYTAGPLTIVPERLEADLRLLRDFGYHTLTLEQFQSYVFNRTGDLPDNPLLITFDDGYLDNYQYAYPLLKKYGMTGTFFIITGLLWEQDRLRPEHIVEMAQAGMSFGSHTVSHRQLGQLSGADVQDELNSSRSTMESVLAKPVQLLAYPQGSYNAQTIQAAREKGYIGAFTTAYGTCSRSADFFELKRIPVFNYDGNVLAVLARYAY